MTYPVDIVAGKTPSIAASAAPEGREEGSSPSKTSHEQPPIGITMSLPDDVMFFEEPQVAMWDHTGTGTGNFIPSENVKCHICGNCLTCKTLNLHLRQALEKHHGTRFNNV